MTFINIAYIVKIQLLQCLNGHLCHRTIFYVLTYTKLLVDNKPQM